MRFCLSEEHANSWETYNSFRLKLENSNAFGVILDIGEDLPDRVYLYFNKILFKEYNKKMVGRRYQSCCPKNKLIYD